VVLGIAGCGRFHFGRTAEIFRPSGWKSLAAVFFAACLSYGLFAQSTSPPFEVSWSEGKCTHCKVAVDLAEVQWVNHNEAWAIGFGFPPQGAGDYIVVHTVDAGRNWREVPHTWQHAGPPAFSFLDASHGWFSCWNVYCTKEIPGLEVRRTADGGRHWQIITQETAVLGMTFSDERNGIAHEFGVGDTGGIVRTTDGGRTWAKVEIPDLKKVWTMDFPSGQIGWIADHEGADLLLFRTLDAGLHWKESRMSVPSDWPEVREISFIDQDHGWMVLKHSKGDEIRLLATKDGGGTWLPIAIPSVRNFAWWSDIVKFLSDQVGFVFSTEDDDGGGDVDRHAVLYTVDGGDHWKKVGLPYSVYSCEALGGSLVCSADRKGSHFGILRLTPK
jgi:photosystem II stability/assembly factor-like uncharacterized protein